MFNEYQDILTVDQLCELLSIGKNSAYKLLSSGKLKAFRYSRNWKIPKQSVIEYIMSQSKLA